MREKYVSNEEECKPKRKRDNNNKQTEVSTVEKNKFDLDDILEREIGQFGRYQVFTLVLAAFPIFFSAWSTGEYIFTTARIPTRCFIEQCDAENFDFKPAWILNAIPGTSAVSFADCKRYTNASIEVPTCTEICPATLFNQSKIITCDHYVYENSYSVVYDFNLGCNEWKRSQIASIRTFGALVALPLTGYISDRWGRRVALIFNVVNTAWLGITRAFVNSYEWFVALQFLENVFGGGVFSCTYILLSELVGPKWRVFMGVTASSIIAVGQVILALVAWAVKPWRTLTLVLYIPQLMVISYYWMLSESVRLLISKGRYKESEKILKKVAKINKRHLSEKSIQALHDIKTGKEDKNTNRSKEPWLVVLVFHSKQMLLRCIVAPIWWITNTLVYFGMNVNAVNLSGNPYVNYIFVAAIEIPAYWTGTLLLDRVGRKPLLITAYFLCSACQFAFAFMPDGMNTLSLAVYLIGKYAIAIVVGSMYLYTAELFPTKYRHRLFAFCSMMGRFGAITAPLTPALAQEVWGPLPSVLFGSTAMLSGILIFFLAPETVGIKLPDTMEEAEQLGDMKRLKSIA